MILAELREIGLAPGVYGPAVDERSISNRALLDLKGLSFLSVNLHGVRAEVVVREADPAPEVEPTGVAVDLTAGKAGRVLQVYPLAGEPTVQIGDEVEAGDTLISGTVHVVAGTDPSVVVSTYPVVAKGRIWAEVEESFSASTPLACVGKEYTGRTATRYEVVVLGKVFKISPKAFQPFAYYDKIEETRPLTLRGGVTLPLSLVICRCREYQPAGLPLDRDSAERYLRSLLENRLGDAVGEGGEVLDAAWQVEERDGVLTVRVDARCREQIAGSGTKE